MKRVTKLFLEHPASVGETYWEHFGVASRLSFKLGTACLTQLAHAVFPFIVPPWGTNVASLQQMLKEYNPESRKVQHCDPDAIGGTD